MGKKLLIPALGIGISVFAIILVAASGLSFKPRAPGTEHAKAQQNREPAARPSRSRAPASNSKLVLPAACKTPSEMKLFGISGGQAIERMDFERASALLENYRHETDDIVDHCYFAAELVAKLCESGKTDDAWKFIESKPGKMRDMQLARFFKTSNISRDQKLNLLTGLEFKQDIQQGLAGYMLGVKPMDFTNEVQSSEIQGLCRTLGISSNDLLRKSMFNLTNDIFGGKYYTAPSEETVSSLIAVIKEVNERGALDKGNVLQLVMTTPFDQFVKWELLQNHLGESGAISDDVRRQLVEGMVTSGPDRAMSEILKSDQENTSKNIDTAVLEWVGSSPNDATDWYLNHKPDLTNQQRSMFAAAFAKAAVKCSELETALRWANEIDDSQTRQQVIDQINAKKSSSDQRKP